MEADPNIAGLNATVNDIAQIYLRHVYASTSPKQAKDDRRIVLNRFCTEHGSMRLADAKPFHLRIWADKYAGGLAVNTVRRWISTVQACFNWCARLGIIERNPFHGVRGRQGKRGRPLTDAEFQALMRFTSDGAFRRFLIAARFTGARPGELAKLEWTHIDWTRCIAVLDEHKTAAVTGEPRVLYFHPVVMKLFAWIRRQPKHDPKWVFVNKWKLPWNCSAWVQRVRYVRRVAGIPDSAKLYGLRHKAITQAIMNGVEISTVAQLAGHRKLDTTQRYLHLFGEDKHLHTAVAKAFNGREVTGSLRAEIKDYPSKPARMPKADVHKVQVRHLVAFELARVAQSENPALKTDGEVFRWLSDHHPEYAAQLPPNENSFAVYLRAARQHFFGMNKRQLRRQPLGLSPTPETRNGNP